MKNYHKILYFLLIVVVIFQLSACKNNQKKPVPQKKPNTTQKMSTPKELTKIENDIETIIKEGQKLQESQKSESSKSSVSTLAPQNQQQGGKSTSKGGNKQKQQKEPPEKKSWITIDKTVKDIHTNWNVLSPIAAKAGASTDLLNNVSTAINTLTTKSTNKLLNDTMIAANNVYKYIPEIENYFKTTSPPDIKKLRFYNRDIDFNSSIGKWDVATKDINDLKVIWKTLKVKLPKDAKTASDKFDSGLSELEKAVQAKDSTITKIKLNVLESDIKSLEKASGSKK